MPKVTFREDRCKGCALCTTVCPKKIVVMAKDKINEKGFSSGNRDRTGQMYWLRILCHHLSGLCYYS